MKNLSEIQGPELEDHLQLLFKKTEEAGQVWANAKSKHEDLEDKRKPLVASLGSKIDGSSAEKERRALASPEYEAYLTGLKEIRCDYYLAQVQYDMAKAKIDAIRTILSNRRAEIQRFK